MATPINAPSGSMTAPEATGPRLVMPPVLTVTRRRVDRVCSVAWDWLVGAARWDLSGVSVMLGSNTASLPLCNEGEAGFLLG